MQVKLLIQKLIEVPNHIGIRKSYYKLDKVELNDNSGIYTEAQFASWIRNSFNYGRFRVMGFKKKHSGFFVFWLGDILPNGFIRSKHIDKQLAKLKEELDKEKDVEIQHLIQEEIQEYRETKGKTLSISNFLKPSMPVGELQDYEVY